MKNPETTVRKFTSRSKGIFISFGVLFILSWAISRVIVSLEVKWIWLEMAAKLLLAAAILMLTISWVTPGLLVILGVPKLAHAWLRGINPPAISKKPWEQLSDGERIFICLSAICLSTLTLLIIFGFLLQYLHR